MGTVGCRVVATQVPLTCTFAMYSPCIEIPQYFTPKPTPQVTILREFKKTLLKHFGAQWSFGATCREVSL